VLVDVDHNMAIMRDESFGPVIGIQRVADDDEAVAAMNDTAYGLTAAVYGPDRSRAEAILQRLDVGSAYWNCADRVSPRLPWSGRRGSGVGATLGLAGIEAFVRPRAWHLRAQP
jgi:acyl-CoA reductase-like NAD-dependent aldehyde dehydrogenase